VKLIVIASRFPYPLEKGDKLRLYFQIKSLSKAFDIYLCSLSDVPVSQESIRELQKYCKEIHVFPIQGRLSALKSLVNLNPFQVNYFYNKKIHKKLERIVERVSPDHIFYQLLRTTEYRFKDRYRKSVDLMDCFSKGYKLRGFKEKGLRKKFYDIESKRLIAYEDKLMTEFKLKFIISEQDKQELLKRKSTEVRVLSNGIDSSYFSPNRKTFNHDIVFVGNMGYEPNIYAVNYLLNELLPRFNKNTKVLIAGARPTPTLLSRANAQITVSGWMKDIRDAYNQSKIFLAPIRDGIGQQNKILEAMAMEVPCIVSKEVALGLDIPNIGEYLLVADTKEEYVQHVKAVSQNPKDADLRAQKARQFIVEHRSWDAVNTILSEALQDGNASKV